MITAIVSNSSELIANHLKNIGYTNVNVYPNIVELRDYVLGTEDVEGRPLKIDKLMLLDDGFGVSGSFVSASFTSFIELCKAKFFNVKYIIYVNKTENVVHREYLDFLIENKEITQDIKVVTTDVITPDIISDAISITKTYNTSGDVEYSRIIKKRRGSREISTGLIPKFSTDKTLLVELPTAKPSNLDNILKSAIPNKILQDDYKDMLSEEPTEELNIDGIELKHSNPIIRRRIKNICVTGESKSGVSTTALTLAKTASTEDKTLLIDLNWDNLGLTYTVKSLMKNDADIELIELSSLIEDIDLLNVKSFSKKMLHVICLSLPVKESFTESQLELLIMNVLNIIGARYNTIIFDIPAKSTKNMFNIMNVSDRIFLCTPPHLNNLVSLYTTLNENNFQNLSVFNKTVKLENGQKFNEDIILIQNSVFAVSKLNKFTSDNFIKYTEYYFDFLFRKTGIIFNKQDTWISTQLYKQLTT